MRRILLKSAMLAMIFTAAVMATSCQKEKEKEEITEKTVSHFNPANLQIEDMNAYLEGFKEKMENAEAKGETEMMDIEEAAWHITSLANYQFAYANAPHNDIRFDTLYFTVNIADGAINIADLNATYQEIAYAIKDFKENVVCENPNFRFIFITISDSGFIKVALQTIFGFDSKYWGDTLWHFDSNFDCSDYFQTGINYAANGAGKNALINALDLSATYNPGPTAYVYYTYSEIDTFYFETYTDPYGSNFLDESRLYATREIYAYNIPLDDMCYLLDSYAGLAYANKPRGKVVVSYNITFYKNERPHTEKLSGVGNHELEVTYGIPHVTYW